MFSTKGSSNYRSISARGSRLFLFLSFILYAACVSGQAYPEADSTGSGFYYTKHFKEEFLLSDFVKLIPEPATPLTVEEVMLLPDSVFYTSKDQPFSFEKPSKFWLKMRITNDTDKERRDYIMSSRIFDTLEVYSVKDGVPNFEALTGFNIPPRLKKVPARNNHFIFTLSPGQTVDFYLRASMKNAKRQKYLLGFAISEDFAAMYNRLFLRQISKLLLGLILFLFTLLGLVMFFSFKEKSFIFYSLFTLSLALYFLDYQDVLFYFVFLPSAYKSGLSNGILASSILVFGYVFMASFLKLKEHMPRLNRALIALTILATIVNSTHFLLFPPDLEHVGYYISNSLIIIYIILYFVPIIIFAAKGVKQAKILLLSMGLMFLGASAFVLALLDVIPLSPFTVNSFQWGVIAFSGTLFYGLFDKINTIQKEKLKFRIEKEKTDNLLYNILPHEVADELKRTGFCEAKDYSNASVLFTDFKDFTAKSTQLTAKELVHEVNACFVAFDHIIEKHKVEKIKTIGDAYMAANGLEAQTEPKVKDIVLAAIEMQAFLNERKKELSASNQLAFEMRIGIHSGPVIAGIVGVKKFQYDIWGDTVNTASRIEAHGEAGKVNISDTTYGFIKDEPAFLFEKRDEIEVKGKGKLNMWFVSLRAENLAPHTPQGV